MNMLHESTHVWRGDKEAALNFMPLALTHKGFVMDAGFGNTCLHLHHPSRVDPSVPKWKLLSAVIAETVAFSLFKLLKFNKELPGFCL